MLGDMEPIQQIRRAIRRAKERGFLLVREDWGVSRSLFGTWDSDSKHTKACCALGAYLVATQPLNEADEPDKAAAQALEVSSSWVDGFTHGWDGFLSNDLDTNDYALGYWAGKTLAEEEGLR